jgi:glycosyltransferase involved in cell wall biosynthesis
MNKNQMNYTLVPHFYRLNWAREMSLNLSLCENFETVEDLAFGNYKKAQVLSSRYLDSLLEKRKTIKNKNLFFVNLNDFIFYDKANDLKNEYNIYGFMRGSRFFDSEPGNESVNENISYLHNMEIHGLSMVDCLFLGSKAFYNFLAKKNPSILNIKTKIVGIPIFINPYENKENKKEKDLVIWNHRLQKQKNPWALFLLDQSVKNNIAVCTPEALSAAYSKEMKQHENIFKYIIRDNGGKRDKYIDVLKKSEFVLSTSEHETWGNSVIEAVMHGATPILPDGKLCSYKELFPKEFLYPQEWINKKQKPEIKKNNLKLLSDFILDNISSRKSIEEIKFRLWDKFNFENWVKKLSCF